MKGSIGAPKCRTRFCRASSTGIARISSALAAGLALAPFCAHAQVMISEIMYNPQGTDSGREWVELYNAGASDVAMVGGSGKNSWRISDSSNHTLTDPAGGTGRGSLVVPAGGYLVVASDPTAFISGEYAGGSYSVVKSSSINLNNTAATVSLVDGSGAVVDSFAYTNALGGNDDGASLQRQADGSWIAALPTPGAANATTAYAAPAASSSSQSSQQTASQAPANVSSYVAPPAPSLYANAGEDRTVIVGADAEFDGSAYDKSQSPLDDSTTRFSWNFGDGSTAEGAAVMHHFDYPGRYAVVLSIAQNKSAISDTMVVDAEPAALSFAVLPDGGVAIGNDSGHDLDLSDWIVKQNGSPFAAQLVLPANSEILAGQTMRIGKSALKFSADQNAALEYPNGAIALGAGQASRKTANGPIAAPTEAPAAATATPIQTNSAASAPRESKSAAADPIPATNNEIAPLSAVASTSQTAAAANVFSPSLPAGRIWWWVGAVALALAGAAALVLSRRVSKHEWDIVEQKDESV